MECARSKLTEMFTQESKLFVRICEEAEVQMACKCVHSTVAYKCQ